MLEQQQIVTVPSSVTLCTIHGVGDAWALTMDLAHDLLLQKLFWCIVDNASLMESLLKFVNKELFLFMMSLLNIANCFCWFPRLILEWVVGGNEL